MIHSKKTRLEDGNHGFMIESQFVKSPFQDVLWEVLKVRLSAQHCMFLVVPVNMLIVH